MPPLLGKGKQAVMLLEVLWLAKSVCGFSDSEDIGISIISVSSSSGTVDVC